MDKTTERFYTLIALSIMATFGCYYWIGSFLMGAGNPQRDDYITGFMFVATLSSPLWFGVAIMALCRITKLNKYEIILASLPICSILGGFALIKIVRF